MFHLLLAIIYLSFISLGLPDSLLGAAWPSIYPEFQVPVSYAGTLFMVISAGTILSSLASDRLTRRFGTGKVTAFSVLTTAIALFGYSISTKYWMLFFWSIPYGLGAGSVDASLNNYVALHYKSWHMNWLHCMWGVGASIGPYILSYALTSNGQWERGYRYISVLQLILTMILMVSLPLWKKRNTFEQSAETTNVLTLKEILSIRGVKPILVMFFCYCAIEQTVMLWASSYLSLQHNIDPDTAAGYASMFCIGITIGRAVSGFIAMKRNDHQMIRLGYSVIFAGVLCMILPFGSSCTIAGLVITGLGCAPIYPSIIHSTPANFGEENSQAIVGVQMASAYTGNVVMPPLFGLIANHISVTLFPVYIIFILVVMAVMHTRLLYQIQK